jgi:hypothetical protein
MVATVDIGEPDSTRSIAMLLPNTGSGARRGLSIEDLGFGGYFFEQIHQDIEILPPNRKDYTIESLE